MNRRYERALTVLTSNKGFEECGDILGDEVMGGRAHRPGRAPLPSRQGGVTAVARAEHTEHAARAERTIAQS